MEIRQTANSAPEISSAEICQTLHQPLLQDRENKSLLSFQHKIAQRIFNLPLQPFSTKKESRKFFLKKKKKKKKVVASAISFPKQNIIYFSGFMSLIKSQRNIVEHQHISLLNQRDIVRIYPHAFFLADPGISIICSQHNLDHCLLHSTGSCVLRCIFFQITYVSFSIFVCLDC